MPLSATQTTQVFEILGVPQDGSGDVFASVATLFGAEYETYDMAAIVSRINTKLAALTATQITRVTELLDRFTSITATSPLQVEASSAGQGVIVDHPKERDAIRVALGNVLGIAVPSGGFMAEARRLASGSGSVER
ncbi:MAG TPA: hypothetical protein VEJ63_08915 [Planctomycetota bacterium]|nr:hypothetical protein [Planctomycetota bacterium]